RPSRRHTASPACRSAAGTHPRPCVAKGWSGVVSMASPSIVTVVTRGSVDDLLNDEREV
ncbi:MAG: hypothetical protein HC884_19800, partial [Chloroflexaceae bacterium]|nr:hypothetical protein [Chloroflexaceae bacterium]